MEQNLPVIAKKFWHMVRVVYFMLRKGISKGKLMTDLNMMMKRGKIAGKAIQKLMFHHSHTWASSFAAFPAHHRRSHDKHLSFPAPSGEYYEFSCSNSPAYPSFHLPFHLSKRKSNHHSNLFTCTQAPAAEDSDAAVHAVMRALEMLHSETASPALPGFGKSPMVRQLRITDSPFPLRDVDEDSHVDEAAEEFISRFYKDQRRQNAMAALGPC
ncbi:uncharacterized protein [Coffea arabica]|uniref:Avr9/Cf-9 rapidly elicited protein 146 n=1 Tax=Coffea arabica TaxID=13443 RepID=A0A6P6XGH6_COFAR|nr:uncharacterized protein LOC113742384 [Coffea arabica]XP_027126061.1 uncharacterized protein LOC113742424 [Coffea arabica]